MSIARAASSACALLIRMPRDAPRPVPTMIAVGVARPSAHGHAMMRTATNALSAYPSRGSGPRRSQARPLANAIANTTGTKIEAIRSTRRWIGAFEPCASSTSRTICATRVSPPTRVTRKRKVPVPFCVPPVTSSPAAFSTGMDSPVIIASSTADEPARMRPSAATISPGRTITTSPTARRSIGTSSSTPPGRRTRALFAPRAASARTSSAVRARARASR